MSMEQRFYELTAQEEACQKLLGYEDGTLLENIARYKRYMESELHHANRGREGLMAYCEKLQEQVGEDKAVELGRELITAEMEKQRKAKAQ